MNNKENIPTTPKSKESRIISAVSPINNQMLKPISPNKEKNQIGKLNFLETDNLDEHFELVHTTQEEIRQRLHNIELTSKQTSVDLGQLFDRLKNNNENLNKLLRNVVSYSEEVMTEGNATKADMEKILTRLDKLSEVRSKSESLKVGISDSSIEEIREAIGQVFSANQKNHGDADKLTILKEEVSRIKDIISKHNEVVSSQLKSHDTKQSELVNHLDSYLQESKGNIEILHKILSFIETRGSDLQQFKEINSQLQNLETVSHALQDKLPASDLVNQITSPIIAEIKAMSLDSKYLTSFEGISAAIDKLRETIEEGPKSEVILEKLEKLAGEKNTSNTLLEKEQEMENKIRKMEDKYALLSTRYEEKLQQYKDLLIKYQQLQAQIEDTQMPQNNRESKMEKLRNFHKLKIGEIEQSEFINERKRIASTPVVQTRNIQFTNNSDED